MGAGEPKTEHDIFEALETPPKGLCSWFTVALPGKESAQARNPADALAQRQGAILGQTHQDPQHLALLKGAI